MDGSSKQNDEELDNLHGQGEVVFETGAIDVPGRHQLNSHEAPVVGADSVTLDPSPFPWTSDAGWITQSPRSSVQLALGQREASMAEHTAMQLIPSPQVTLVNVISRSQQPTSIDSLENMKEESKKSK